MPVGVAVVGDELDVRPALGHAPDEGEVTAYGPQPSRRWYVVIAAINYEDSAADPCSPIPRTTESAASSTRSFAA